MVMELCEIRLWWWEVMDSNDSVAKDARKLPCFPWIEDLEGNLDVSMMN